MIGVTAPFSSQTRGLVQDAVIEASKHLGVRRRYCPKSLAMHGIGVDEHFHGFKDGFKDAVHIVFIALPPHRWWGGLRACR